MTNDEIKALAKRLEDVQPHENVPFTCYRGAAALRHLMARVSELEKERDAASADCATFRAAKSRAEEDADHLRQTIRSLKRTSEAGT